MGGLKGTLKRIKFVLSLKLPTVFAMITFLSSLFDCFSFAIFEVFWPVLLVRYSSYKV